MKLRDRVQTLDYPLMIGTVIMLVSNKALIRWHKGYKTWHMVSDLVLVERETV